MKITINTRTGEYKEEPTTREQKNTEQEDYELQGAVVKYLTIALANKITSLGKTPNQRKRFRDNVVVAIDGLLGEYEMREIPHV